ncbi:phenoloxidase-activating factor 3 [Caerostris extrusa]|uniref:Phenoloxidase-activating factor 3 n=1 Tax=Caerostris extrusa TaxID=172846 RepID=A0AAV4W486_CAEEX|nr:phenoloxidase-activating factor 3 [Caerostris extrusa]
MSRRRYQVSDPFQNVMLLIEGQTVLWCAGGENPIDRELQDPDPVLLEPHLRGSGLQHSGGDVQHAVLAALQRAQHGELLLSELSRALLRRRHLCVEDRGPEGKVIRVKFSETFDIRAQEPLCVQDYLAVSLTGDFATHVKRYCHGTRPLTMVSSGNSMLFMFRTDCCFEGKGFSASFAVVDSDEVTTTPPPDPRPQLCTCGEENIQETERILGGKTVNPPNRYPWVVALVKKNKNSDEYFCGGALISRQYVLTAAHCLEKEKVSEVRVALGAHNADTDPAAVAVSDIIMHPKYYNKTYLNDIALVRLQEPATLGDKVKVACMPLTPSSPLPMTMQSWLDGGGRIFPMENTPKNQEVELSLLSHPTCVSKYGGVIQETNLCAGGMKNKDACSILEDPSSERSTTASGTPWAWSPGAWAAAEKGYPGVYTKVSEYLDWIAEEMSDSPPCDDEEDILPPVKPNLDNCGIPNDNDEKRIAGGVETQPVEFPWMVSGRRFYVSHESFCIGDVFDDILLNCNDFNVVFSSTSLNDT